MSAAASNPPTTKPPTLAVVHALVARVLPDAARVLAAVTQLDDLAFCEARVQETGGDGGTPKVAIITQWRATHSPLVSVVLPVDLARALIGGVLGTTVSGPNTPPRLTDMECGAMGYVAAQCIAKSRASLELVAVLATDAAIASHLAHTPAQCVYADGTLAGNAYVIEVWFHERES